jgi:uncharacterized membrane protein YeiH
MKPFKMTFVGKLLIGVADAFTGGTISNVVYQDENTPAGAIDFKRAGISIATIILVWAFVTGKVNLQDFNTVFGLLQ